MTNALCSILTGFSRPLLYRMRDVHASEDNSETAVACAVPCRVVLLLGRTGLVGTGMCKVSV